MRRYLAPLVFLLSALVSATNVSALEQGTPVGFYGRGLLPLVDLGPVDRGIPAPDQVLGFPLGERPARSAQVIGYLERLARVSPRVAVFPMGETYEGRPLVYAAITSPENMKRLDQIKANLSRLADPRVLPQADVDGVVAETPAAVWLAYSIHGDELSGVDAGMGVAYRLAAGTDSLTQRLLDDLVILIDPNENPDGRERFLAQMESFATAVPFADGQSLQKGGFWPWGRGNHYLFDMNRDWFAQELVESRARIAALVDWQPQVVVDAHEMGSWDTYLFSPARQPFNAQLTQRVREWWDIFAADQAAAFDRHGWAYYTREWNEEMYPGYGSSWPMFQGAVGILYEQAGVSGSRVARHDGTVLTYSESVAHQYVSSIANLVTAADHRERLLGDYYLHRERAIKEFGGSRVRAYLVRPDANVDRRDHLAQTLQRQGIDVFVAQEGFKVQAQSYYETTSRVVDFPAGTMIVHTDQPEGFLIQTILDFDPRIADSFLVVERRELLKHRDSKLYEVTSWSLLQAYGVDAFSTEAVLRVRGTPWEPAMADGGLAGRSPQQGFIFECASDRSLRAVAVLLSRGMTLYAAKKDLDVDGLNFTRGSIFVPRRANAPDYEDVLDSLARTLGIRIVAVNSGKGALGPDLGGGELELLRAPKVAVVAAGPTSFTSLGSVWFLLDQKLGVAASLVDVSRLGWLDLSIYNVLIMPDSWGSFADVIGKGAIGHIKQWVRNGGTLIALEGSAAFCADTATGLSSVRIRRQVLEELERYEAAALEEIAFEAPDIGRLRIWEFPEKKPEGEEKKPRPKADPEETEKQDELARLFSPHGAILRVNLDTEHWLTFGLPDRVPALMYSQYAFLARYPDVRTVGRLAPAPHVRISGLLWPEARHRLANTAFCTREGVGQGQIILFAADPGFRAYFRGAERLLANAILFGPGMGARWTPEW